MFFYHVDENVALNKWKVFIHSKRIGCPIFSTLFLQIQLNSCAKQKHSLNAALKQTEGNKRNT